MHLLLLLLDDKAVLGLDEFDSWFLELLALEHALGVLLWFSGSCDRGDDLSSVELGRLVG